MDIYWLEQETADVPPGDEWLGSGERLRVSGMRFVQRRTDWRLGRWTAKRAIAARLKLPANPEMLARIQILPLPSGAPEVLMMDQPAGMSISLSHRAGRAACVVAAGGAALGCDLEIVEDRSAAFAADYFTPAEQTLIGEADPADRSRLLGLLWSAKESALKALGAGLRLDTRSVTITLDHTWHGPCGEWRPLAARCDTTQLFRGWWQQSGNLLRTVMAAPPCEQPILLEAQSQP